MHRRATMKFSLHKRAENVPTYPHNCVIFYKSAYFGREVRSNVVCFRNCATVTKSVQKNDISKALRVNVRKPFNKEFRSTLLTPSHFRSQQRRKIELNRKFH